MRRMPRQREVKEVAERSSGERLVAETKSSSTIIIADSE
jgi:hypothetical protein